MRRNFRWLLVLFAASLLTPAMADELVPFRIVFGFNWHGISAGTSEWELERLPDGRWSYGSRSLPRGLARLALPAELTSRSVFRVHNDHIVPENFNTEDGARSTERDQLLNFDWTAGRVTGTSERKPVDLPTQPGLLDPSSAQVALMHDLLEGRTPTRFVLVDKGRIKENVFSKEGAERLRTAVGEYDTIIYRSRRPGSDKSMVFWCAPALGYLPLKIERRDGRSLEWSMSVRSVERPTAP